MLQKLQKKPLKTRKKILLIGVITVSILMLPFWYFGFNKSLNQKSGVQKPDEKKLKDIQDLKDMQQKLLFAIDGLKTEWIDMKDSLEEASRELGLQEQPLNAPGGNIIELPQSPNNND